MSDTAKYLNLEYNRVGQKSLLLDLEIPKLGGESCPVIINIHGGGWAWGSKDDWRPIRQVDRYLLEQNFAVVSINYRLSSEAIFPAQIVDCKAAIRWVRAKAKQYNLDSDKIGVWGWSAGGHLAALLGTTGDTRDFDQEGGNLEYSSQLSAVAAFAPTIDFSRCPDISPIEDFNRPLSPEARLLGGPIQQNLALARRANPITYLTQNCPPFLVIQGEVDPIVPVEHSLLLQKAFIQASLEMNLYIVPDGGHGIGDLSEAESSKIIKMVHDFFIKHLKKEQPVFS